MDDAFHLKVLRSLISQTPLIVDQKKDGGRFQAALSALSTTKLRAFYRRLKAEERRRFHYVANICLGYEAWSGLYRTLVVHDTQEKLADLFEEAYASKSEELRQREEYLEEERQSLEEQIMLLESENLALRQENLNLKEELNNLAQGHKTLKTQQQQLMTLLERYRRLIADLRRLLPDANLSSTSKD